MNTAALEQYRANRQITDPKFTKVVTSSFMFNLFMLGKLPMAFIAGLKVKEVTMEKCSITVPYRWMNQNPFRSTYFAVLAMAAEMSTGMLALMGTMDSKPSVSMLVTHLEADFVKKATGITTFTCTDGKALFETIEKAILTGEGQNFTATSIGYSKTGEVEAQFKIQWSFKAKLK
jgi:hypothetical protein